VPGRAAIASSHDKPQGRGRVPSSPLAVAKVADNSSKIRSLPVGGLFAYAPLDRQQARPGCRLAQRPIGSNHGSAARNRMTSVWEKAGAFLRGAAGLLSMRRDTSPIDSVAALEGFVTTRSTFIAQKTLYGYVKTRMGIRYPAMFEDKNIIASLNIAKMHVFAACLSDLTIYAVAVALRGRPVGNDDRQKMARRCYTAGMRETAVGAPAEFSAQDCIDEFDRRLDGTDWQRGALQPENFSRSPAALVRWAPIADNLKKFDDEIIENSVKFAWLDVREQFNNRLDAVAVADDWARQPA
jgi:hypothetical protein